MMPRAFLVVMDSVGIGGAPDAGAYFNADLPDLGANTLAHIAQACAAGQAEEGRSGPLHLPNLDQLGLGAAVALVSAVPCPDLGGAGVTGRWGAAREISRGKDTPSGHWELAGLPVPWRCGICRDGLSLGNQLIEWEVVIRSGGGFFHFVRRF